MKFRSLLIIALAAVMPAIACAKKPVKAAVDETVVAAQTVAEEEPIPEITDECTTNVSIVHENVKNKQFAVAYEPWLQVYTNCPNANKSIYSEGAKILDWKWSQATDEAEKEAIRTIMMELYDKRIKWFGDDPKYPKAYILGEKALSYCDMFANDELKQPAYNWLKESISGMGQRSKASVLTKYFELSYGLFKSDTEKYMDQFMADYGLVGEYLQAIASDHTNKTAKQAAQQKDYVDNLFAISGVASCDKLDALYADYVQANKSSLDEMLKIVRLYKKVGCNESDVYFAASEAAHQLSPSEESAAGCARMQMKQENWRRAIEYYQEALALDAADEEDDGAEDNAEYLYTIAYIYYNSLKDYQMARSFCRQSLDQVSNQGRCYILIGLCYAAAQPYSTNDYPAAKAAILNKTVYWAAVDKLQYAKQIDPTCAEAANSLISSFSKYFPTKEDIFDLPNELGGATFVVGGWINEKTVCRPAK